MKKLIHIFILFVALSSLIFVPVTKVNASKKVTLTYHSGKGYFKSSLNRGKSKISIRNKLNKKRGYAPAIRRDGYAFVGWYTKKNGGTKYSSKKIITSSKNLYAHWLKKYKLNTNYFVPLGTTYSSLSDYEPYWGNLKIVKKKIGNYTCSYTLTNSYGDSFSISGLVKAIDDDGDYVYDYSCSGIDCKLKNLVNIIKTISVKKFLKKLGVKSYNFYPSDNYVDFVYGSTRFSDETYDTDIVWQINLNSKNQVSPDTIVSFDANDDWEHY
mgnify:CR=1 FL=1